MDIEVVILGAGYVGLALAQAVVSSGARVTNLDVNAEVVERLQSGVSSVETVTNEELQAMLDAGFAITADEKVLWSASIVVICVPTPLSDDGSPDLRSIIAASETVGRNMQRGCLVVLESTSYPGTTEEVVRPILEDLSGMCVGRDFALAFSPERIDPGSSSLRISDVPKIVGGTTERCGHRAKMFYERFVQSVVVAEGTREAEMAKLLENTYRQVNIALVNELAQICHDLDINVWNVLDLAGTKPFGFHRFDPGPGVGGHCIPVDPVYLSHKVRVSLGYSFHMAELAQSINEQMPDYIALRAVNMLLDAGTPVEGATVLILGVTYKADVADHRHSPARAFAVKMRSLGCDVRFHDPFVETWEAFDGSASVADIECAVRHAHLTVLIQSHSMYNVEGLAEISSSFFDTRGASSSKHASRL